MAKCADNITGDLAKKLRPRKPRALLEVLYLAEDHPKANWREKESGEKIFEWRFPIEDGRTLVIQGGIETLRAQVDQTFELAKKLKELMK